MIVDMLERTGWNQTEAAERFQIPLSTLNQKIKRLGIETRRVVLTADHRTRLPTPPASRSTRQVGTYLFGACTAAALAAFCSVS